MKRLLPRFVRDRVREHIDRYVDAALDARAPAMAEKIQQLNVQLLQTMTILEREHDVVPPPPHKLQVRVVGAYVPEFVESGYSVCEDLNAALAADNRNLADFQTILDFGCGCGRVSRALKNLLPLCNLYGTDIDAEAIEWLQQHYARFGKFSLAPHWPPTSFKDEQFDFIYGVSVFTHLPEDMQHLWLKELRRITKVGGYLVLSIHGERFYRSLATEIKATMAGKGFYYSDFNNNYGQSIDLPDFYQTAFHSADYIRTEWGRYFDVLDIKVESLGARQDTVLLRRPSQNT